jgi:hypothetical protein
MSLEATSALAALLGGGEEAGRKSAAGVVHLDPDEPSLMVEVEVDLRIDLGRIYWDRLSNAPGINVGKVDVRRVD